MSNLKDYLSITNRMKPIREEIKDCETKIGDLDTVYDKLIDDAEIVHGLLNELEKRFATGNFCGPRIWIEVIGMPSDKKLGIPFDYDRETGPDFEDIKMQLDSFNNIEGSCMIIDETTRVIACYNADTKTIS